jgi:uncharacterized protein (DUF2235 family)
MSKNLVVCCDGTNNEIASDATNVLRLYRLLVRDPSQIAFYDSGVGTVASADRVTTWGRNISKRLDSAMGLSIRHHFLKAYRFLSRHYEPGDRIYLFGFSRGAYTARAVAGAIYNFGLLRPELAGLEDLVWAIYSGENNKPGARFAAAPVFKKAFGIEDLQAQAQRHAIPIHGVGVWDTVSAFGTISDQRTLPNTARNPNIVHIRHALAIDEQRSMFQANLFRPDSPPAGATFKQVWFAGVHSDVGGGYAEAEGTLSKVSLNWMLDEFIPLGLQIDANQRQHLLNNAHGKHPPANPFGEIHNSLVGNWHVLEMLPQRRYSAAKEGQAWHGPNLWRPRPIVSYDPSIPPTLHQSVIDRRNNPTAKYAPPNLPQPGAYTIEP